MDDAEFDRIVARAGNPNLIPGIYNYCDRRCERCRFATRCFDHLERRERGEDDLDRTALPEAVHRSLERAREVVTIIGRRIGLDLSVTDEELQAAKDAEDDAEREVLRSD